MVRIWWIALSAPAFKPVAVWSDSTAPCISSFSTQFIVLPITRLKTLPMPIGLTPGFLFRKLVYIYGELIGRKRVKKKVGAKVLANKAICSLKCFASALNFLLNCIWQKWSESTSDGPLEPFVRDTALPTMISPMSLKVH